LAKIGWRKNGTSGTSYFFASDGQIGLNAATYSAPVGRGQHAGQHRGNAALLEFGQDRIEIRASAPGQAAQHVVATQPDHDQRRLDGWLSSVKASRPRRRWCLPKPRH
jgi:hypothetical protein